MEVAGPNSSLEERLEIQSMLDSDPCWQIGTVVYFVHKDYISGEEKYGCQAIIPPPPTAEVRNKVSSKENAEIYLVNKRLQIFSTTHDNFFLDATVNLPEATVRDLNDTVADYKHQIRRQAEHLLMSKHRRFSQNWDGNYVNQFLDVWRNLKIDYADPFFAALGLNPLFVRYDSMRVEILEKYSKFREPVINAILSEKEIVGVILLLPEYKLVE